MKNEDVILNFAGLIENTNHSRINDNSTGNNLNKKTNCIFLNNCTTYSPFNNNIQDITEDYQSNNNCLYLDSINKTDKIKTINEKKNISNNLSHSEKQDEPYFQKKKTIKNENESIVEIFDRVKIKEIPKKNIIIPLSKEDDEVYNLLGKNENNENIIKKSSTQRETTEHKCHVCGAYFKIPYNLRVHMKIHNREKPYLCTFPGCFAKFSEQNNLNYHYKTHFKLFGKKSDKKKSISEYHKKIFRYSKNSNNLDEIVNKLISINNMAFSQK